MSRDKRASEIERREAAQKSRGKVRKGSGRQLEGRRLDQMVSLRLAPELVSALRALAEETGRSISDLLREAALTLVSQRSSPTLELHVARVFTGESVTSTAAPTAGTTTSELKEVRGPFGVASPTASSSAAGDRDRLAGVG